MSLTSITLLWVLIFATGSSLLTHLNYRSVKKTAISFALSAVCGYFFYSTYVYFMTPSFTGTFWGQGGMIMPTIIAFALKGALNMAFGQPTKVGHDEETRGWASIGMALLILAVGITTWIVTYGYYSWSTPNVKEWAALANVRVAPESEKLPPTNVKRIQVVTERYAQFVGLTALGSGADSLSSRYTIDTDSWTRLGIGNKTYWVAPLQHRSGWLQFTGAAGDSVGYVKVEAENENPAVEVLTNKPLKVLPNGWWDHNFERYVYYRGYHQGNIRDVGIEIDDEGHPFMTATYTVPKFVIGGEVMTKLIVVDATTGDIKDYDPEKAPVWVDRTLPQDLSKDYATWWGHYHHKDATWLTGIFNGGINQTEVADSDLVFNDANQSVYSMPMSSVNNADGSATGLLLYSTRENKAVYYPGMNGIPVGSVVENTFSGTERNVKKYEVKQIQLYAINGEPTYVAIYTHDQGSKGETFAAIGFMHAKSVSTNNVIYASSVEEGLQQYSVWLAGVSKSVEEKTLEGEIFRVGRSLQNGTETFVFKVMNDHRTFSIKSGANGDLPLLQPGDKVSFKFVETGTASNAVSHFRNLTIEQKNK